jgi:hypothetical protein
VAYDGYGSEAEYSVLPLLLDLRRHQGAGAAAGRQLGEQAGAAPAGGCGEASAGSSPRRYAHHLMPCVSYHLDGVTINAPVRRGAAGMDRPGALTCTGPAGQQPRLHGCLVLHALEVPAGHHVRACMHN